MRRQTRFSLFLCMILALVISACASGTPADQSPPTGTAEGTLRLFPSETPTETPVPTGFVTITSTPTITPTPTQVLYEVQLNDDMYAIAYYYGISAQAIMTANPDVNPNAMTVGMQLVIPITPSPEPTATPTTSATEVATEEETETTATLQKVTLGEPDCYPDVTGGLWCFILAANDTEADRENVSARVTVSDGDTTLQETAIMPLNLLPAGEALPLVAYFEAPLPMQYSVTAELDFYLPVMPEDDRYLSVAILGESVTFNSEGDIAYISGSVSLDDEQVDSQYTWVSAMALDVDGRIVAVRRWEAAVPLTAGSEMAFELTLYSYAGEIDRVLLLAEAQPAAEAGE